MRTMGLVDVPAFLECVRLDGWWELGVVVFCSRYVVDLSNGRYGSEFTVGTNIEPNENNFGKFATIVLRVVFRGPNKWDPCGLMM